MKIVEFIISYGIIGFVLSGAAALTAIAIGSWVLDRLSDERNPYDDWNNFS